MLLLYSHYFKMSLEFANFYRSAFKYSWSHIQAQMGNGFLIDSTLRKDT